MLNLDHMHIPFCQMQTVACTCYKYHTLYVRIILEKFLKNPEVFLLQVFFLNKCRLCTDCKWKTMTRLQLLCSLHCVWYAALYCMCLMGGRPYGCLYHDLYNDDYTELCVITFTETITLDRYHNVKSESEVGNNSQRVIKTDSYFSSQLIDNFFLTVFMG